jgi:hypothetical protein
LQKLQTFLFGGRRASIGNTSADFLAASLVVSAARVGSWGGLNVECSGD